MPNTTQIGSFYITKESGVSSGVRRIEAVCGHAAYEWGKKALDTLKNAKDALKAQDVLVGITKLQTQLKELKQVSSRSTGSEDFAYEQISGCHFVVAKLENTQNTEVKTYIDEAKNKYQSVAILLIVENEGKIFIAAGVKNAPLKAGMWVKEVAQTLGGNGGGRDDFATAGGKDVIHINKALECARKFALEHLREVVK